MQHSIFFQKKSNVFITGFIPLIALLLFIESDTHAQIWTKKSNGLFGGNITSIVSNSSTLFAGTRDAGIFASTDNGMTWTQANNGISPPYKYITSMTTKGDTIFAGLYNSQGVFFSVNNGGTWQQMNNGLGDLQITALSFHDNKLFAGTVSGIYVTSNFSSWTAVNSGLPAGVFSGELSWINTISSSETITIAGLNERGAYLSTNDGGNWLPISAIPNDANVTSILFYNNLIFIGAQTGLYVSADNGVTWNSIGNGLPFNYNIYDLTFQGSSLFACTGQGLFQSVDNGSTWSQINIAGLDWYQANFNTMLINGNDMFLGSTTDGVLYSNNNGTNWIPRNTNLTALTVGAVVSQKAHLFASTPNGLYVSSDSANLWQRIASADPYNGMPGLLVKGDTLLSSFLDRISFTTDFGASWNLFGYDNEPQLLYTHNGDIYASDQSGLVVFRSKGSSWTNVIDASGSQYEYFSCMTSVNDTLFAGTWGNNVYVSVDNGTTWQNKNSGLPSTGAFYSLVTSKNRVLAGVDGNIYYTDNAGSNWIQANLSSTIAFPRLISASSNLFAGDSYNEGAYFSPDNGNSWASCTPGNTSTISFWSFTSFDSMLFAGTTEGVWVAPLSQFSPKISSFSPTAGTVNTRVTIQGENFSVKPDQNIVSINGVKSSVLVASPSSLVIEVLEGTSSGKITVSVNGKTAQSDSLFCYAPNMPSITFSYSVSGAPILTSDSPTGNQWLLNGRVISGATSQNYSPSVSGTYAVEIKSGSCEITSNDFEFAVTEIDGSNKNGALGAYPIPFTNELNLDLRNLQPNYPISAQLIDSRGAVLDSWTMESPDVFTLDTKTLSSGIYLVRINQMANNTTIRALKN